MKRSALVFPCLAAVLAVVLVVLVGPFGTSHARGASSLQFQATFSSTSDFAEQFDYGYSGNNPYEAPLHGGTSITSYHGDHDMNCGAPTTSREIVLGGDVNHLDYSQVFWSCLPGGDPAKGHLMTGVDTTGYNIAWFSPKQVFTNITKVCWDQNLTMMSMRKWTQVQFVSVADSTKYPADVVENPNYLEKSPARGSGGYDLGFVSPEFAADNSIGTHIVPSGVNAGLKITPDGSEQFWDTTRGGFTGPSWGDIMPRSYRNLPEITDKAGRYQQCVENQPNGTVLITRNEPEGVVTAVAAGQIPKGQFRVVFQDDNYNPPKDERYDPSVLTWHWDNIQVYGDSAAGPVGTTPPTTRPSTPPTTTPPPPPAPPAPAGGPPFGSVDQVSAGPGSISVAGWAIDPDTAAPIDVHVYVDGSGTPVTAAGRRDDVGAVFPGYGPNHGFSKSIGTSGGWHTVCFYGINVGSGGNSLLGCRDVNVPSGSPLGSVDQVSAGPGSISVAGWAIDPDTAAPIDVHVYVDGSGTPLTAAGRRDDVGAVFPPYGPNHGYTASVRAAPGTHQLCAYGINVGAGGTSLLGCQQVTVPGGPPIGSLDVAVGRAGAIDVAGWAIDPDTSAPITVHVYVDGSGVGIIADGSRPDVGGVFPAYGSAHGFSTSVRTGAGAHQVCVYGINTGAGGNSLLGCRTVVAG